jgi:topoisomerase-4 subunit A
MKAMGNRLSQHPVKKVELIAEIEVEVAAGDDLNQDDSVVEAIATDELQDTPDTQPQIKETVTPSEKLVKPSGKSGQPPEQSVKSSEKSLESTEEPVQSLPKKIDFEITNPDDIEIDDKGQLGLF